MEVPPVLGLLFFVGTGESFPQYVYSCRCFDALYVSPYVVLIKIDSRTAGCCSSDNYK